MIAEAILHGRPGIPEAVAFRIARNYFTGLARTLGREVNEQVPARTQVLGLNLDIGRGPGKPGRPLMHEDSTVRQDVALSRSAMREEELPGAIRHAERHSTNIAGNEVDEITDGEHCGNEPTRRINEQGDVCVRVFGSKHDEPCAELSPIILIEFTIQEEDAALLQVQCRVLSECALNRVG